MSAENGSKLFLEYNKDKGWIVNNDGRKMLENVKGPINSVAIIGPARIGKSFLMNMLHQKEDVFCTGAETDPVTKGIWISLTKHPTKSSEWLLLLDTEGLKHINRESAAVDTQICTLALLLCGSLIFYLKSDLDSAFNEDLQFLVHYTNNVQVKANSTNEDEHKINQTPNLCVVVRNYTLNIPKDSADGYLARALEIENGTEEARLCRQAVNRYFPKRHCFLLPLPKNDDFSTLSVKSTDIKDNFTKEINQLRSHVFKETKPLLIGSKYIDGETLVALAESFAKVVSKGGVMCIEQCMQEVKQERNREQKRLALELYEEKMTQELQQLVSRNTPSPLSRKDLHHKHMECRRSAVEQYRLGALFDPDEKYFLQLLPEIDESYTKTFVAANVKASEDRSQEAIKDSFKVLEGDYSKKGGLELFKSHRQAAIDKYKERSDLGPSQSEVLGKYLEELKKKQGEIIKADGDLFKWEEVLEKFLLGKRDLSANVGTYLEDVKEEKEVQQLELKDKESLIDNVRKEHTDENTAVKARYEKIMQRTREGIKQLDKDEQDKIRLERKMMQNLRREMDNEMENNLGVIDKLVKFVHQLFGKKAEKKSEIMAAEEQWEG